MSQSLSLTSASLSPTTARSPRVGVVFAVVLHAAVVAATLFSWRHTLEIADQSPPVIPVDLVTVGDKTNIAPTVQQIVKPQDVPAPPPAASPPATPAPPPQAEAAPELAPMPQAKPAPPPQPAAKPAPAPAPTPPKPKTDAFADLLNNLTKPAATPRNARVADRTVKGAGAMNAMTMDLVDALKNQIAQCWSPPVGGPNSEQLRPQFHLQLNRDGTVVGMPQLTAQSAAEAVANPYMRAAADAARRAIMTCQPYKLPPDKYDTWRDITSLDFDPSKAVQ